jgi:hypothetical protein
MQLIAKKVCNTLLPDAEASQPINMLLGHLKTSALLTTYKYLAKGLWVGGNAFLYDDYLSFWPNGLNALLHKGDVSWQINLMEITNISISKGLGTQIINLKFETGVYKLRCIGAKRFAETIRGQIERLKRAIV